MRWHRRSPCDRLHPSWGLRQGQISAGILDKLDSSIIRWIPYHAIWKDQKLCIRGCPMQWSDKRLLVLARPQCSRSWMHSTCDDAVLLSPVPSRPMDCAIIAAPPVDSMRSWEEQSCLSWWGRGTFIGREMVSNLASALGNSRDFYFPVECSKYSEKAIHLCRAL